MPTFSRRQLLQSLPAFAWLPRALAAQAVRAQLRVSGLHSMTVAVSDVKRSLAFYQGLFGMPVQARHGDTLLLRIGSGPKFMALSPVGGGATPGFMHFGMAVENFSVDRVVAALGEHGVTRAGAGAPGSRPGPMQVLVRQREGTPEIFVGDPSGVVFQLQDPSYCGGAGPLGSQCASPQPASTRGLLAPRDFSHFTIASGDAAGSNKFYQELFGFGVQAYQGPTAPVLGVGGGVHFVMFTGGGAARGRGNAPPRPPRIDHACLGIENFNPDAVIKVLEGYGIKPRGQAPASPLVWYISQRMENRGGAPGTGTPELYFTDPDNIPIQIQDVKYCGGSGFLGDVCPG